MFKKVCSLLLAVTMLTGACGTLTANAAETYANANGFNFIDLNA